jgi:hypothetical protein
MRSSTLTRIFGILFAAIVLGALIGWWASRTLPPKATNNNIAVAPTESKVASSDSATTNESISVTPKSNFVAIVPNPIPPAAEPPDPDEWEDKLDEILVSDTESNQKGEDLLKLMPTVNTEAQTELAGHIVNLLDDDHFLEAGKYLTNASVPEAVSSVFMDDLYNRENSLKLPLVLAIASNEKHPLRDEAKDLLELYIEEDHGTNWAEWQTAMNTWLQEHKDD